MPVLTKSISLSLYHSSLALHNTDFVQLLSQQSIFNRKSTYLSEEVLFDTQTLNLKTNYARLPASIRFPDFSVSAKLMVIQFGLGIVEAIKTFTHCKACSD